MARATKPESVPQSTLDHFGKIPWCAKSLEDPAFQIVSMSRTVTQPGNGHSLMADTWNTEKTITALLSMYKPADNSENQPGEVRRFYTFGSGMNAHPDILHGGVIATILDSTMGNAVGYGIRAHGSTFTVALNVTYKKPVTTPGTIMARSWIKKVDGRKVWIHGAIENESGELHATAEGMWLTAKARM